RRRGCRRPRQSDGSRARSGAGLSSRGDDLCPHVPLVGRHRSRRTAMTPFEQHVTALAACRLCPNVLGTPVTGPVRNARVMLVGQAPGPHELEERRPFAYTAGRRLFTWFATLGISEE